MNFSIFFKLLHLSEPSLPRKTLVPSLGSSAFEQDMNQVLQMSHYELFFKTTESGYPPSSQQAAYLSQLFTTSFDAHVQKNKPLAVVDRLLGAGYKLSEHDFMHVFHNAVFQRAASLYLRGVATQADKPFSTLAACIKEQLPCFSQRCLHDWKNSMDEATAHNIWDRGFNAYGYVLHLTRVYDTFKGLWQPQHMDARETYARMEQFKLLNQEIKQVAGKAIAAEKEIFYGTPGTTLEDLRANMHMMQQRQLNIYKLLEKTSNYMFEDLKQLTGYKAQLLQRIRRQNEPDTQPCLKR